MLPLALTADFETRSEVELKNASYHRYAGHISTGVLCLGLQFLDQPHATVWRPFKSVATRYDPEPEELIYAIENRIPIYCHNTCFDRRIHEEYCVKRLGWRPVPPELWRDTMAICAYYALPQGLDKAANALGLGGKDKPGASALKKVSRPRKPRKKEIINWMKNPARAFIDMPTLWYEDKERLDLVADYCGNDVELQTGILRKLGPLPAARLKDWQFCMMINERGIYCDLEHLRLTNAMVDHCMEGADEQLVELTKDSIRPKGRITSVNSAKQFHEWLGMQDVFLGDLKKETVEEAQHNPQYSDKVRKVLSIRANAGKSSLSKISKMMNLADDDSRLRDGMVYHGASTGRLSGRAYQPHNFVRDALDEEEAELFHQWLDMKTSLFDWCRRPGSARYLSRALRSYLRASPGHKLYISDFAAIEPRITAWLANVPSLLQAFSRGECVYNQFASMATGREITSKKAPERQLGKAAVIGLGYGMGWQKFIATAAKAPYFVVLTESESKRIVGLYRSAYHQIPEFQKALEKTLKEAIRHRATLKCGRITIGANADWAWIVLPSGRAIWYYKPILSKVDNPWQAGKKMESVTYFTVDSQTKQWRRTSTYGGKIVENIVQGTAGDFLMGAKYRVDDHGYPPILSVHDEVVSDVPDGHGSVDEFHQLMKTRPTWAPDCPVECETKSSLRYGK